MKSMFIVCALALSVSAFADQGKRFAACYGDHHGTYLDFKTDAKGTAYVETSNDGDDAPVKWTILSVEKDASKLQPKAYSWAIRQAIQASAQDGEYGMVMVKAKRDGKIMYVQLNKYLQSANYLSVEGYVEALTCPLESIAR